MQRCQNKTGLQSCQEGRGRGLTIKIPSKLHGRDQLVNLYDYDVARLLLIAEKLNIYLFIIQRKKRKQPNNFYDIFPFHVNIILIIFTPVFCL